MKPLGVGVIGLGFMGRTHLSAWNAATAAGRACRVVAVCDQDVQRRSGRAKVRGNLTTEASGVEELFDPDRVTVYARASALLDDRAVDVVSITTPTESHVELGLAARAAGKHVLVEKPVSLRSAQVARLARAARGGGPLVMPAFCMRFWPGWDWLAETIARAEWGPLLSLGLRRLSARPDWNPDFYEDPGRCGAALFDLHLHDADLLRWCLGDPQAVLSVGSPEHLTTAYRYRRGPGHVVAEAGWDLAAGHPFQMAYSAVFARASAEYDFRREQPLLLCHDGSCEVIDLEQVSGYERQVLALLDAIEQGRGRPPVTLGQAWAATRLLEAEATSLSSGEWCAPGSGT